MATAKSKARAKSAKDEVKFGVHSEVGQLRKVMVCAPGVAHSRLTPSNCDQLLFDDVLSAVDHHTEQILIHTLLGRQAAIQPTSVIVTHRMSALQHCDRVVVLDAGRVVQFGTHAELLAQHGVYREAWETQQGAPDEAGS